MRSRPFGDDVTPVLRLNVSLECGDRRRAELPVMVSKEHQDSTQIKIGDLGPRRPALDTEAAYSAVMRADASVPWP